MKLTEQNEISKFSFDLTSKKNVLDKLIKVIRKVDNNFIVVNNKMHISEIKNYLSFFLAIRYMGEEKRYGQGGGEKYITWINNLLDCYNYNKLISTHNPEKIQKILLKQYRSQQLILFITELLDSIKFNFSESLNTNIEKTLIEADEKKVIPLGLQSEHIIHLEKYGLSEKKENTNLILDENANLINSENEKKYALYLSEKHTMVIIRATKDGKYFFSLFDPNFGIISFDNNDDFTYFIDKLNIKFLKENDSLFRNHQYIQFEESDNKNYDNKWEHSLKNESIYVLQQMKENGYIFRLNKNVMGKIVEVTSVKNSDNSEKITSVKISLTEKNNKMITIDLAATHFNQMLTTVTGHLDELLKNEHNSHHYLKTMADGQIKWVNSSVSATNEHGSYLRYPALQLAMLPSWAPENFTDPKQYVEMVQNDNTKPEFKFIIHTTSLDDLINHTGIFSLNVQNEIQQWDTISASVISDKKTFGYKSVGVILKVPPQNILAADNEDMMSELNIGVLHRTQSLVRENQELAPAILTKMQPVELNGLLSEEIFLHNRKMSTPDDILSKTSGAHNEIIIAVRPGVNIHPGYPATGIVEVTGLFLMNTEPSSAAISYAKQMGHSVLSAEEKRAIFTRYARPIAEKNNIPSLVINGRADIADISATFKSSSGAMLGDTHHDPVNMYDCDNWDKPTINASNQQATTRFDGQIIIQLEDNSAVMAAAANLIAKHPNRSVLVQLDIEGNYRVIYGTPAALKGKLRWQLVGHGRGGEEDKDNQDLGGRNAEKLAINLKRFNDTFNTEFTIKSQPQHISLVGCSLISQNEHAGYGQQLALLLNQQNIRADISVYGTPIGVNHKGQKCTYDAVIPQQLKFNTEKLVLHWNKDNELIHANSLAARLERTSEIVNDLVSGKVYLPELDTVELDALIDFFHTEKGVLDSHTLQKTITDLMGYSQFCEQAQNLMQLSGVHSQFSGLTGKAALRQSKIWNELVIQGVVTLDAATRKNTIPEVKIRSLYVPQGMYIGDGSALAKSTAANVGLAYLSMLSRGKAERLLLLHALKTHAEINEQKAEGNTSLPVIRQAEIFRSLINELGADKTILTDRGLYQLDHFLLQLNENAQDGYYQLMAGKHCLTLAKRKNKRQKTVFYLYDPNYGEARFSGEDNKKTIATLAATLNDLLITNNATPGNQLLADYYGIKKNNGQFEFRVYQFDTICSRENKVTTQLQQLLKNFSTRESQQMSNSGNPRGKSTHVSARLLQPGRIIASAAWVNQNVGWIRSATILSSYWRRLNSGELNSQQKQALEIEINLALGGLVYDLNCEVMEHGLTQLGYKLSSQTVRHMADGLSGYPSRIARLNYRIGLKLVKFAGPILNIFGSGFDIYSAYQAIETLKKETDPKVRTDLQVSIALSSLGAAVSIAAALVLMAGGTAATFGGPIGAVVGIVLASGGGIYSAVRQIQEIKSYVSLTPLQELRNGWFIFWGQDIDPEIFNKLSYEQKIEFGRKEYHQNLANDANNLLLANSAIDTLYYSHGTVDFQTHPYKKLVGRKVVERRSNLHGDPTVYYSDSLCVLKDKIKPEEGRMIYEKYRGQIYSGKERYIDLSLEDSDYHYFVAKEPEPGDDEVNVMGYSSNVIKADFLGQKQMITKLVDQHNQPLSDDIDIITTNYRSVMGYFHRNEEARKQKKRDIIYFSNQGIYLLLVDESGTYNEAKYIQDLDCDKKGYFNQRCLVGDINRDGLDDVILFSGDHVDTIVDVLLTQEINDKITFTKVQQKFPHRILSSLFDYGPLSGDINGDGIADLISFKNKKINIYYGTNDMENPFSITNSEILSSLTVGNDHIPIDYFNSIYAYQNTADINGDGFDDVVSITHDGEMFTLLGTADRQKKFIAVTRQYYWPIKTMLDAIEHGPGFKPSQIQLYDMNDDGRADLIVIRNNGRYSISYGQQDGTFGVITDGSQSQEGSKSVVCRPNILAVRSQQHIIGITQGSDGNKALLSRNITGEVNAHTFKSISDSETIVHFRLGGRNDKGIGHQDKRNFFEVAGGTKIFQGGSQADTFLFMGEEAPNNPSVLNGGEGSKNNVLIAGIKPAEKGYYINLQDGCFFYHEGKKIATLLNINNVKACSESDDIIIGNDEDNYLDGAGGNDHINGNGGNDVIILQAGMGIGGAGVDSFHILQNNSENDVEIIIKEDGNKEELTNVLLKYDAKKIISISLKENDILITLHNDNGSTSILKLTDVYFYSSNEKKKKLAANYLFYSRDGIIFTGLPATLLQSADGDWPSTVNLLAQYNPDFDQRFQTRIQGKKSEEIIIYQQSRNMQGKGQIVIAESKIVLPEFMQLFMQGSRFKDRQEGDGEENFLKSSSGGDILVGKGGADYYLINSSDVNDEISIDNYDAAKQDALTQDLLILPLSLADIRMTQEDNDIIFSHRHLPKKHPRVRIIDFKLSENHRHLSLMDKEGKIHEITLTHQGRVSLILNKITSESFSKAVANTDENKLIEAISAFDTVKTMTSSEDGTTLGTLTINQMPIMFTQDNVHPGQ